MRLIEIPDDGIVRIPIMCGEDTVGENRINLSHFPTIDAVKVTRCKDCKLSYTPIYIPAGETQPVVIARFCGMTNRLVKDDGYCDEAIPKED